METYVHKQDNSNYLNDNMLQKINIIRPLPTKITSLISPDVMSDAQR